MQTTTSGYNSIVGSSFRQIGHSVLVSWLKNIVSTIRYFSIDTGVATSPQGPNSPTAAVDDNSAGAVTWANPTNVFASDGVYATATIPGASVDSHYLKVTGFNFSLPTDATVNGIVVEIQRAGDAVPGVVDETIKLVKAGTITGNNKADTVTDWPVSEAFATYGTSSDTWGLTLTGADVNDATFGVAIQAKLNVAALHVAKVDYVRITIYFSGGSGAGNASAIGGSDILKGSADNISFFDKYQYNDYTRYAKNWSVDRQIGQYPFGIILAQADVELDNSSKLFTPGYDATIGSGILPARPLKIAANMGSLDSFQLFTGFTGQPEQSLAQRSTMLHAYDVIDYLNNYRFTSNSGTTFSGMLTNTTIASGIRYYLGKIGFNSSQMQLDASLLDPIPFINVTDRKFGDVLSDMMTAEQGLFFADESGFPRFWNKQHFLTTSGLRAFAFDYSNTLSIEYANAPIINDVSVTAMPRAVQASQNVYSLGAPVAVQPGQTQDIFASFTDDDGSLPVTSVTVPSYSATAILSSYYSTNANSDGSGAALNTFISVAATFLFGTSYKITFRNTGTQAIYITALVLYGTPAKVTNSINVEYYDQASIDAYGRNPANNGDVLEIQNDFVQSQSAALAIAFGIVTQYKAPNSHYRVNVFANPALQIGDYGTLTLNDLGQTKTTWIVGKTDKLSTDGDLTQELILEERTIYSYFTINSSLIAGTDVIAP
jgi:hypothetical protein